MTGVVNDQSQHSQNIVFKLGVVLIFQWASQLAI